MHQSIPLSTAYISRCWSFRVLFRALISTKIKLRRDRSAPEPAEINTAMNNGRHRYLTFLYLTCLAMDISVAPNIAPTSRGFVQGQPELQQAMDNRQPEDPSRKRQAPLTSGYLLNQGYPALFKRKTSDLLQEAETMLNRVKIFKERIWLQTFLYRLKSLERALEQTEYLYNAETYNDYNDFINSHFGKETEKEGFKSRISEDKLEKGILSTMLQHEVAQLQSKGKSQAEITKTLHLDNPHYASIINPSLNTQESNRRDINNFEAAEPNQANKAIQGVNDLKQDEKVIVGIKPDMSNSEEIQIYSKPPQPKVTYINNTYQHMLLNGPTADSKVQEIREPQNIPGNAAHEHHDAIQDSIAYLQKQDQPTYAIRSHVMQPPNNLGPNYPHFISYPYVEVPKGTLKPQRQQKQSNVLTPLPHYSEYIARGSYAPYPYLKLWDHKNATFLQSHLMTSIPYKSNSSHKIDAELSDDMKRQLRDGKIIVLSDSLVRKF
ncbi:uncharacterized protein LOC118181850 isoform X3 [Stegodyphus dumicola]|uniref:uncharacterized protein LOC118181850 isoform X3 n=1 Tax=Stegodyphus dumicola TaxID=202533 RepID=UPI0015AF883D|nr:uncharacterized protein LOC118181850 isoform X3 [Stegodyphus dumicola]